jgi:Zn-dependent protease with chaperone function
MLLKFFNFVRLNWHLAWDRRVSIWLKLFLLVLPAAYALVPLPDDILPVVGMLDDLVFLGLCMLVFVALCPLAIVTEHRRRIDGTLGNAFSGLDGYRYPTEQRSLALGFTIALLILALSGWLAGLIGLALFGAGYLSSRAMRGSALGNAVQVSEKQLPQIHRSFLAALSHLPAVKVELFVTQNPTMNAFTYGYSEPYNILLTSGLVERLNEPEIQAIIGHELGHIYFGHVRLTNLMTGLGNVIGLLFYRWRRDCEYSADAVALLASGGELEPVISSFLKLSSGLANVTVDLKSFLEQVDGSASSEAAFAELGSTHPFINNRIRNLIKQKERESVPVEAVPQFVNA